MFFSPTSLEPGDAPQRKMLHENLRRADALVAVLTHESADRPYVTWETASTWGRGKVVIPMFVGVHTDDVEGPLASEAQGVRYDDRDELDKAVVVLGRVVHEAEPAKLTDHEFSALMTAAEQHDRTRNGSDARSTYRGRLAGSENCGPDES